MRKPTKIAFATLCAGMLVTGIGAGVAFAEYSSLRFEELPSPLAGKEVTVSAELEVPSDAQIQLSGPYDQEDVVVDEAVPVGTVVVSARANGVAEEIVIDGPFVDEREPYDEGTDVPSGPVESRKVAHISAYPMASSAGFLEYKDVFLEGLKSGVVYRVPSMYDGFSVELRMNPADVGRVL